MEIFQKLFNIRDFEGYIQNQRHEKVIFHERTKTQSPALLTRAHPVVSAEHQRPGGGVDFTPPPTISKTTQVREKRYCDVWYDWEKHYKKHSDNFSLKSKLRSPDFASKGKIFPNFGIT